jgi:hypothetical protein
VSACADKVFHLPTIEASETGLKPTSRLERLRARDHILEHFGNGLWIMVAVVLWWMM